MTEYTPTTDEVRNSYIEISFRAKSIREEQFDRWLQKVKADTLDEMANDYHEAKLAYGYDYQEWVSDIRDDLRNRAARIRNEGS